MRWSTSLQANSNHLISLVKRFRKVWWSIYKAKNTVGILSTEFEGSNKRKKLKSQSHIRRYTVRFSLVDDEWFNLLFSLLNFLQEEGKLRNLSGQCWKKILIILQLQWPRTFIKENRKKGEMATFKISKFCCQWSYVTHTAHITKFCNKCSAVRIVMNV